ncbi:MAG TPA: methylmalonyl-CoA mutase family protein [Vulgatibacter sp.]
MIDHDSSLLPDDQPLPSLAEWRALAEAGLGGATFERKLVSHLEGGLRIQPLYTRQDLPPGTDAAGFPGFAPLVRGQAPLPPVQEAGESRSEDPVGALARNGHLLLPIDEAIAAAARRAAADTADAPLLLVSTEGWHDAGATAQQELALAMATGVAYLRALEAAGLSLEHAARRLTFRLQVGVDVFLEIAKLRAARRTWCRILEACGVAAPSMDLQARTAWRTLTARDPWTNLLRNTIGAFAARAGGAARLEVRPFDEAVGEPDELGSRMARNTRLVLDEESHLGRVVDPAGGSFYLERLTEDLAAAAWAELQEVEGAGGIVAALRSGMVQDRIEEAAARRAEDVATRKLPITGVSEFPNLRELPLERRPVAAQKPAEPAPGGESIRPLRFERLAAGFERLRDRSDAHAAATGSRPRVFLASFGPPSQHLARSTFVDNLFAAGGVEAVTTEGCKDSVEAAAAFATSGTKLAVICAADAAWTDVVAPAAKALREAGATRILLAGRPGDKEAELRAQGIDGFVSLGMNALDLLESTLSLLQVAP